MALTNSTELVENIEALVSGKSRMFLRGGTTVKLDPSQTYVYKGRTTLSGGLGMTRAESTDTTAPSDKVGGDTTVIQTVAGSLENRTVDILQYADKEMSEVYWGLIRRNRAFDMVIPGGASRQPQDVDDWDSMILVEDCVFTELTLGDEFNPQEEANTLLQVTGTISYSSANFRRIGQIAFAEVADSTFTLEALDCGYRVVDNGIEWYILVAYSTGVSEPVIVGRNYQGTYTAVTMAGAFANTENANKMAIVGSYAVIASNDAGGHATITLANVLAGTDGSAINTSGYTASKEPNCIWARSAGEIFLGGDGGYVYKLATPTGGATVKDAGDATTQNLNAIHGYKDQIVAVGESNAFILSEDNGENWSAKTGPNSGESLTAVWVHDEDIFFVGCLDGDLYYTTDAGDTWTQITHGTSISNIHDIEFVEGSKTVGYMVGSTGSAGEIVRTIDGGATWSGASPYIKSHPAAVDLNAVSAYDTNTVMAVGEGAASDGIAILVEDD